MKPIETIWKGYRFRSRTEARWAVFLEAAGVEFEYEPEGVLLPSGPYLPDFRLRFPLPEGEGFERLDAWLEIKGDEPTDAERKRCAELCQATGCPVLLAIGPPDFKEQVLLFDPEAEDRFRDLFSLMVGELAFMNVGSATEETICVGRGPREPSAPSGDPIYDETYASFDGVFCYVLGIKNGKLPIGRAKIGLGHKLRRAYDAARAARFEFGQTDPRWKA